MAMVTLPEGVSQDIENCPACEAQVERECDYHLGFTNGWDMCSDFVKRSIDNGDG